MAFILKDGSIQFGDGTTQSTASPTRISAFTNNSGYVTTSSLDATYALRTQAVHSVSGSASRRWGMTYYSVSGAALGSMGFNCNCNC